MNELSNNKTMSVKEIADLFNLSDRTIRRHIEILFPDKMKDGSKTLLNEKEVTIIKLHIEKNPNLDNEVQLPKTNLEKKLIVAQAMKILKNLKR